MKVSRLGLVLNLFILVLASLVVAEREIPFDELCGYFSFTEEECAEYKMTGFYTVEELCTAIIDSQLADFEYDNNTDTCFAVEAERATTTSGQASAAVSDISTLESTTASHGQRITALETDVNELNNQITGLSGQIDTLNNNIQALTTEVRQNKNEVGGAITTLEQDLSSAQEELGQVEEGLEKEQTFTKFLKYSLLIIIALGIALLAILYLNKFNIAKIDPRVVHFITMQIRGGKKYFHIKDELLKAGWEEKDIEEAYKKTLKSNYQKYLESKPAAVGGRRASPGTAFPNKKKTMSIIGISAILVMAVLGLFVARTAGKAIEAYVHTGTGELELVCTPPQILAPNGFSCCTDVLTILFNGTQVQEPNGECDVDEGARGGESGSKCLSNFDCISGEICLNKKCGVLSELSESDCGSECKFTSVEISTSDGEEYSVVAGQGSYTAAGAIEWRILSSPVFCAVENIAVPIEITRKRTVVDESGDTVPVFSKEVITIADGKKSPKITHPAVPGFSFVITIDSLGSRCD